MFTFQISTRSFVSLSALAFSIAACGSAPSSEAVSRTGQASTAADPAFTACTTDDDCVAIKQAAPGCCNNGWLVAVNCSSVDAYDDANTCATPAVCPHYILNDTRVASCDATSNECTLVVAPVTSTGDDDGGTDTTSN